MPAIRSLLLVSLLLTHLSAALWLQEIADNGEAGKTLQLLQGHFPEGKALKNGEATLFVRDMEGNVHTRTIAADQPFSFREPLQGNYHLFAKLRHVEANTLHIDIAKTRIYNRYGNSEDALLEEIRGKSVGTHYGKPPLEAIGMDVVLHRPIKNHQINCCIYSGDKLPFKVYVDGMERRDIALRVTTQKGWTNRIEANEDTFVSFEVPRTTYADIYSNKRYSEHMLVEASHRIAQPGVHGAQRYESVLYTVALPLRYHASPLEYSSKLAGFLTLMGVMIAFSLGAYYHRKRQRKRADSEWLDEHH